MPVIYFLLLWQPPTELYMDNILRINNHADTQVKRPGWIRLANNAVVIHDHTDDVFWVLDLNGVVKQVFGGRGDDPGQLAFPMVNWFIQDEEIHVIHKDGQRYEVFTLDGKLLASEPVSQPGQPLFPMKNGAWVTSSENPKNPNLERTKDAFLVSGAGEQALDLIPSMEQKNLARLGAVNNGDWLLLATTRGNTNRIYWSLVDLQHGAVHKRGSFETVLKTTSFFFDEQRNRELPRYFMTVGGFGAGHDGFFYLTELGPWPPEHPRHGLANIVHRMDHEGNSSVVTLFSGDLHLRQLLPLGGDRWVATAIMEGSEGLKRTRSLDDLENIKGLIVFFEAKALPIQ